MSLSYGTFPEGEPVVAIYYTEHNRARGTEHRSCVPLAH
jgi:hypothetical protein